MNLGVFTAASGAKLFAILYLEYGIEMYVASGANLL